MKKFIKDLKIGFKDGIKFMFHPLVIGLLSCIIMFSMGLTIIIGYFTDNLGLVYMSKEEALNSFWFLVITHTGLSLVIFVGAIGLIFLSAKKEEMKKEEL